MPIIIRDVLADGIRTLREHDLPSPELDTEILLRFALGWPTEAFYQRVGRSCPKKALRRFREALARRERREPIAYITGEREFFRRPFRVTRDVLVPRPETEWLVEEALRRIPYGSHATIADIGTGSGCIGVTLAIERPKIRVCATDISDAALACASKNAIRHRVRSRVELLQGDLLAPIERRHIDGIIANLPYVPDQEVRANPDLFYEPLIALRGRFSPHATLAAFLDQWYRREHRPFILLEIHPNQREYLDGQQQHIGVACRFENDLSGKTRYAVLEYRGVSSR